MNETSLNANSTNSFYNTEGISQSSRFETHPNFTLNGEGCNPLHIACMNGDKETVEHLISQKVDINAKCANGHTPLYYALYSQRSISKIDDLYKILTEHGALPSFSLEEATSLIVNLSVVNLVETLHVGRSNYELEKFKHLLGQLLIHNSSVDFNACPPYLDGMSLLNFIIVANYTDTFSIIKLITQHCKFVNTKEADSNGVCSIDIASSFFNFLTQLSMQDQKLLQLMEGSDILQNKFEVPLSFFLKTVKNILTRSKEEEKSIIDCTFSLAYFYAEFFNLIQMKKILYESFKKESIVPVLPKGNTLLHLAVEQDDIQGIKLLLNSGQDPRVMNSDGLNPLSLALKLKKSFELIALFRSKKINGESFYQYPLHDLVLSGDEFLCDQFLECGANVDAKDNFQRTALCSLLANPEFSNEFKTRMGLYLISRTADGADFSEFNDSPIFYCIKYDLQELFNAILPEKVPFHLILKRSKTNPKKYVSSDMANACIKFNRVNLIKDLCRHLNVNSSGESITVLKAVKPLDENMDFLEALLNSGEKINEIRNNWTYLLYAVNSNASIRFLNFLVGKGAVIRREQEENFLFGAVHHNNIATFDWLLERGINPSDYDPTLLHSCVRKKSYELVKRLIVRGVKVNAKDRDNKTPLEIAVQQKDPEMINLLKEAQRTNIKIALVQDNMVKPILLLLKNKKQAVKSFIPVRTEFDRFNLELTFYKNCPVEKIESIFKEVNIEFKYSQDNKHNHTFSFDPTPLLMQLPVLKDTFEKHFTTAKKPAPQQGLQSHSPAPIIKKSEKADADEGTDQEKEMSKGILLKQKKERELNAQDFKPLTEEEKRGLPDPLIRRLDFVDKIKAEVQAEEEARAEEERVKAKAAVSKGKKERHQQVKTQKRTNSLSAKTFTGSPRRPHPQNRPAKITLGEVLTPKVKATLRSPATNFSNYYSSAQGSLISIGDMLTRIRKEEYNLKIERDLSIVIHALEYRLLRLSQALTATGYNLNPEEREDFNAKTQQIIDLTTFMNIRNHLRHAECVKYQKILDLSKYIINSHLSAHLKNLLAGIRIEEGTAVQIEGADLESIKWSERFSEASDEKEKEYEGGRTATIEKYILDQFAFLTELSEKIGPSLYDLNVAGDKKDAMKMCLVKMGQCLSLLDPSEKPIKDITDVIRVAGNAIAHDIEELIPYCTDDDIPDEFLHEFLKNLKRYKELFSPSNNFKY